MGKETVQVRESPGFVTTRLNALIGNEAFWMLHDGVASARDIDKAAKMGLNHPMGPFELVDLVGLDTRLSILRFLHERLGEKYRPCPLLEEYVRQGRLGPQSRAGSLRVLIMMISQVQSQRKRLELENGVSVSAAFYAAGETRLNAGYVLAHGAGAGRRVRSFATLHTGLPSAESMS